MTVSTVAFRTAAGAGAALLAGALLASSAAAQRDSSAVRDASASAEAARIDGVFLLDSAAGEGVEEVIDRGVALLPWYKRPFARGRLRETTSPAQWVSIEPGPGAVRIRTGLHDLTIPWQGGLADWEWKPGDHIAVTAAWDGGDLIQDFHGSDGSRYNRYVLSEDGDTLELRVRIESDQLAEPLRYRLVYVRRPER